MYFHCRPTRVQSSPGPRSTSSASSSGATTPRPATATPTVPPPAPSRPSQPPAARQAVQLSDLQNILSHMQGREASKYFWISSSLTAAVGETTYMYSMVISTINKQPLHPEIALLLPPRMLKFVSEVHVVLQFILKFK